MRGCVGWNRGAARYSCPVRVARCAGGERAPSSKSKTVSENLKMGSALLSRFDLIFILVDKPDARMDKFLSEHVMAVW